MLKMYSLFLKKISSAFVCIQYHHFQKLSRLSTDTYTPSVDLAGESKQSVSAGIVTCPFFPSLRHQLRGAGKRQWC